jgi:single-strand DNA-binding protein
MSINKVLISGNLTRDPELRATSSGMEILQFGVAFNDRRKNNQTGQWEDYVNFVDCVMFGKRAGSLSRYLHKGSKVAIEGKLRWLSWEDSNGGGKRSKLEVVVDEIELMSQQGGYQQQRPQQRPQQQQQGGYQEEYYDSDCPF